MSAVFQALTWEARDVSEHQYIVSIFGWTADGRSVCVSTEFKPYFYVKLGNRDPKQLFYKIKGACAHVVSYTVHKAKVRVFFVS